MYFLDNGDLDTSCSTEGSLPKVPVRAIDSAIRMRQHIVDKVGGKIESSEDEDDDDDCSGAAGSQYSDEVAEVTNAPSMQQNGQLRGNTSRGAIRRFENNTYPHIIATL